MAVMMWTWALLLFASALLVASSTDKRCPLPQKTNRATFHATKDLYTPKETLSYSCNTGFRHTGKNSLLCKKTGIWAPKDVKCERIKCERFTIANGKFNLIYLKFNTTVNITCQDGYDLKGPSVVTCGGNGTWTPALPICENGKCQPPPFYPNAHTEQVDQRHYEHNTTMRYKCNHGYRMVRGPSTIYCRNGQWTDLEMKCEKKTCGSAGEIINGRYHYTGSSFGDTATASCNEGFRLVGEGVRTCRANGWDGRVSVCEAIQCPEPPMVPNADLYFDTSEIIKHGSMVSYVCRFGTLIGASEIFCTEDGTWSSPAPRCEVTTCLAPEVNSAVVVPVQRALYQSGSSVTIMCNPGWRLLGPDVITCGTDGQWEPRLPKCVNW